ncbi:MAG: hypothetical protein Q4F11_00585 [Eubacteriales bacterium]|nr:hypothetical protein [Eubacteriales bacterium]
MKYRDKLIEYFSGIDENSIVSANRLYEEHFARMTECSFFKALERLAKDGIIVRAGKGMYSPAVKEQAECKAESVSLEEAILNYYFGENNDNGMYIGYQLYNKYGLTQVKKENIELFSNIIKKGSSHNGNVYVKKIAIELDFENTKVLEALEILQNYYNIEELDKLKFARYARQFARGYNDEAAVYVIENVKYKKSTIAFMKKILDMYKVKNSLSQFLSYASKYKVPALQRVAR